MSISFPMDTMRVRFAGETNTGLKRSHNEDCLYLPIDERLVMVADGMGGHARGDIASKLAIETIGNHFASTMNEKPTTWPFMVDANHRLEENRLLTAIQLANIKIFETAQKDEAFRGMGTTIVACFFVNDEVLMTHVGDSRIYRIRHERITQLTLDHSLLNDYVKIKKLSEEEMKNFPHKNVIVRALGMKDIVGIDLFRERPQLGDIYLLCSDGLTGMVPDPTILETVMSEADLDRCCERLIEQANANGGVDNVTVALARLEPL